jgi:multimeric flavodoxin WrbA
MVEIVAVYGSPRRDGNTSSLLRQAVKGAREGGAEVAEYVLRDLKISPCLELYACKESGRCAIRDDFQDLYDRFLSCRGVMLASPMFFYAVSAHTKAMMDRCQSLWVKRYWIENRPFGSPDSSRKGLFISAGATRGKRLFEGSLLTVRYFFDALDMVLWRSLLYRGLDFEGDVDSHPAYLEEARRAGREMAAALGGAGGPS